MSSAMQELFDEIRENARQEGIEKGKVNLMIEMVKDKIVSIAEAAKRLGMSEAEFTKLAKA